MELAEVMEGLARLFEVVGVLALLVGGLYAGARSFLDRSSDPHLYTSFRRRFGRTLLLGLEVLVAADIVRTVAVDATLDSVLVLAILVLVRTVLSLSLDTEIDGVAPWRRAELEARRAQQGPPA
jgi:uncharacterized membrane protein